MFKILFKFFDFAGGINKKKFHIAVVLGIVIAMCDAMKIPAIAVMISAIISGEITVRTIFTCTAIMLGSMVVNFFVRYTSTMLQTEAGYTACADKRIEIAEHLRYLPMGYFNNNSLGSITSVTTNTMESLGDIASRVVMMTTQGILNTVLVAAMILFYDWRIGIVVVLGLALYSVVNSMMQRRAAMLAPQKMRADTALVEGILEYIQGIAEVKAYNLTGAAAKKLVKAIDGNADINIRMEKQFIGYMTVQNFITKALGVAMSALSIALYIAGSMDLLIAIVMIISSFMIYAHLDSAGNYSALLRIIDASIDKAKAILDLQPMDTSGEDIAPKKCDIDVEDIGFSYDTRKIIDGVSLHIPEKTTTAFVGPSGGGKTTLCSLISRFWDVQEGRVLLGGKDVKAYSMDSLMKNFSFVFQNVYLFHDTIANNIRFGQSDAPMSKVIAAAKKACCHEFISALPDGYDTVIGEGGASLSGGEKQRISIARAIMKDAPIIVLDEATANVDPENEKELMEAIDALTKKKTILMIAHRLKTVRDADQIVVVDQGKIAEQGTHASLMRKNGIYRRFVDARKLAVSWKI